MAAIPAGITLFIASLDRYTVGYLRNSFLSDGRAAMRPPTTKYATKAPRAARAVRERFISNPFRMTHGSPRHGFGQYRGEFVERFHGALRDGLAGTLVRESIVRHNHSCPVALLEELHDYSRDGLAKISVVGDPFRPDDLVVPAGKRKLPRSGD